MYCDDGSDGYGEFSCEEINSEELEFQIVSMLENTSTICESRSIFGKT